MSAWIAGRVLWFDHVSGEGLVIGDDGDTFYVHKAAILQKSPKSAAELKEDARVEFTIYDNGFQRHVDKIKEKNNV